MIEIIVLDLNHILVYKAVRWNVFRVGHETIRLSDHAILG